MLGSAPSRLVVLLASVLKPVDDTRMRGKVGETLRQRACTEVHIAGRSTSTAVATKPTGPAQIHQHSLFSGVRLSLDRLGAQWRYWRLLQQLQPGLVLVHAPELLPLTLLWQALGPGRKFLYDIRENYALNVATQGVYAGLTRRGLAAGLRWVETSAARCAAALLLAEASYADELPFLRALPPGRVLTLENKYQPAPGEVLPTRARQLPAPAECLRLLYSGTISELNGLWEAIALAKALHQARPGGARLTIIGFCQQPALLARLQAEVARHPHCLELIGGAGLVPHAQIVQAIGRSHLGLLPYRPHPSTERCRPTKLFEYLAHGLPVLLPPNPLWRALVQRHDAGLEINFNNVDAESLLTALYTAAFYPQGVPTEVLWAGEAEKLQRLLDSLV